ncbi:DUF3426 domain-containing protein [Methylobacterium sp. JK268]
MLIVCPSCAAEYRLDPDHIGPEGRTVRCASCRVPWYVAPPEPPPGELSPPGPAVFTADEPPAPPPATRPATRRRRLPAALVPVGCTLLALLAIAGVLLGRERVVRALPQTARLYAAIGLPVNLRGLAFRDVVAFALPAEGRGEARLVVEGDVVSASGRVRDVPPLALELRDETDQVVYRWTAEAPRRRLQPEETARFRAELEAPPPRGRRVLVRFAAVDTAQSTGSVGTSPPDHE